MHIVSSFMQILGLSSITKKGEMERAFPSLSGFGVDDNAICGLTVCLSIIGIFDKSIRWFVTPPKLKRLSVSLEA